MRARRAVFTATLLAVLAVASARAQAPAWQTYGPPLFEVNALAAGADELTVYAGGADHAASQAALFRSADSGRHWETLVEADPGEFYSDILVDPASPGTIYAGSLVSGSTRISRTGDGGATWSLRQTIPSSCLTSFAPGASAGMALVACGTHLLRTNDAGLTWQDVPNPFTESTRLTAGPAGSLFAYGTTRIFKSVDGGTTWTAVGTPLPCAGMNALRVDPTECVRLRRGRRPLRRRRTDLRRHLSQHERGQHVDRERPPRRLRHRPRHRFDLARAGVRMRRIPRGQLPEGRSVREPRRGRGLVGPLSSGARSVPPRALRQRPHAVRGHFPRRLHADRRRRPDHVHEGRSDAVPRRQPIPRRGGLDEARRRPADRGTRSR